MAGRIGGTAAHPNGQAADNGQSVNCCLLNISIADKLPKGYGSG
jgi:hypothetical protein